MGLSVSNTWTIIKKLTIICIHNLLVDSIDNFRKTLHNFSCVSFVWLANHNAKKVSSTNDEEKKMQMM